MSHAVGSVRLVYAERRMELATASCVSPLQQIQRTSPLSSLISPCCWQYALSVPLCSSFLHSQPFSIIVGVVRNIVEVWNPGGSLWLTLNGAQVYEGLLAGLPTKPWTALRSCQCNHTAILFIQQWSGQTVSNSRSSVRLQIPRLYFFNCVY